MNTWTRWADADHPRTPDEWRWPGNLLVAQGPAGWSRGRRAANEAEEILSEAVAWWDVERSGFRDGDRWLRNIGQAGSVLDLRLGSSLVANSNDPKYLAPEASGYVYLPGVSGNALSVPDEAALDITGDIDVRVRVAMDDWTPGATSELLSKRGNAGDRSWMFRLNTGGTLNWFWSTDGTAESNVSSSAAVSAADGDVLWVRVTHDVDNGLSQNVVRFYQSADGVSWSQVGSDRTQAGVVSLFVSAVVVRDQGASAFKAGRLYRAQVLNGIDGTVVLDVDCDAITSGSASSFTAVTGQTVTINRSTSGRMAVGMPARRNGGRACMSLGSDDFLEVTDSQQHGALNFHGDSFTAAIAFRIWTTQTSGILAKRDTATGSLYVDFPGWGIVGTTNNVRVFSQVSDGINGAATAVASADTIITAGKQHHHVLTVNRATGTMNFSRDGNSGASAALTGIGGLQSRAPLRVGRAGAAYANMEFRGAAIWRRALTARERAVLANSNIWGT